MKAVLLSAVALMSFIVLAQPSLAHADSNPMGIEKVTYDLGIAQGDYSNETYTEAEIGLGLFFSQYLEWRNGIFARFTQDESNTYGLDSSVRGIISAGGDRFGVTAYAGPGYRLASQGDSAPLVEGGLVFHITGFSIGVGVKSILDSWIHSGVGNDTQIVLIVGGGGVF